MKDNILPKTNCFIPDYGVAKAENFGIIYPVINNYILNNKDLEESRNGEVKELLDVKTIITNPYKRCTGGYGRDINVFFLLAEAIWIVSGRSDVEFLNIFNSRMKDFSDDGIVFHAPYGFRLRHWGSRSDDPFSSNVSVQRGFDQVLEAIRILYGNPNSRQVVMSIWNPVLDLGSKSRDIPCNDLVMFKIRNGKLITTIANRSNDLHWGLPTNVFQFSFLSEVIASCLGIELGTQTHNSQSLHIYNWNGTADEMDEEFEKQGGGRSLYESTPAEEKPMDFNFSHDVPTNKFIEINYYFDLIIRNLLEDQRGGEVNKDEIKQLQEFSHFFHNVYRLLSIYVKYKQKNKVCKSVEEKDAISKTAISEIELMEAEGAYDWDMAILAKNFFASRLTIPMKHDYLGKL